MEERLTFNEWQAWLHATNGHALNKISDYCQNADVDLIKVVHEVRQAEFATAKASNKIKTINTNG